MTHHTVSPVLQTAHTFIPTSLLYLLLLLPTAGCSDTIVPAAVRPDLARDTLVSALTAWKSGQPPDQLQTQSPSIVVQDLDWVSGATLQDFKLQSDGEAVGANLSIEVELALTEPGGKPSTRKVWYLVGTDPVLTVFRDMLR